MNAYRASPIKPAVDHVEFALRHLVLAVHHVEANGFALEVEDIVADLDQLAADIELIATGGASSSDLREAMPADVIQAVIGFTLMRRTRVRSICLLSDCFQQQDGGPRPAV